LTTASSVRFHLKKGGSVIVDGAATVVNVNGIVQYAWSGGDIEISAGTYVAEFEVAFSDGKTHTFPSKDTFEVVFREPYT